MKRIKILLMTGSFLLISGILPAQDLMDLLNDDTPKTEYAYATFKGTHVVLGQSVENPAEGVLQFIIAHNFGRINQGPYEFFGLDQSTIRLGLDYGIKPWLGVGIGRSSYQKTYDGYVKAKILRQKSGAQNFPVTVNYFGSMSLNSLKWSNPDRTNLFSSRLSFTHQLLIARKFSNSVSLQLSPTLVHKNLVATVADANDLYLLGAAGRFKLSQRTTLNLEYFYGFNKPETAKNTLSVGLDMETGGHVFQFRISNAQPMFEPGYLTETTGDFFKGDIYLGFTISRVFTIVRPPMD
jgi:hypothetical protein